MSRHDQSRDTVDVDADVPESAPGGPEVDPSAPDPVAEAAADTSATTANGAASGQDNTGPEDDGPTVGAEDHPAGGKPELDGELSVEGLVSDLERVTAERDQYIEASRRIQAEFENYRKQVTKRETQARERANEGLIGEMLPVLDAFDGALLSGVEEVAPMRTALLDALAKQGLERIDPAGTAFDPNLHEAVMHEEGEGGEDGPIVAEVMRAGYSWKGRVVRPAMVRVRG